MSTSEKRPRHHDLSLVDAVAGLPTESFSGVLFRVTRLNADPTAFSTAGGRWAPPANVQPVPTLYTSLEREGAIAEVVSYLAELSPRPTKPIMVHRLRVTASAVVRMPMAFLHQLGVDDETFKGRPYARPGEAPATRSQEIGAVTSFLERDGLIVPSARWPGENFVIYGDNHGLSEQLGVEESEELDWLRWMDAQRDLERG